jgi:hypothetical protein
MSVEPTQSRPAIPFSEGAIMSVERIVLAFAGTAILLSLALAHYHSPNWLWFTAFVGFNLVQSAFTRFCPLALILKKLGREAGNAF